MISKSDFVEHETQVYVEITAENDWTILLQEIVRHGGAALWSLIDAYRRRHPFKNAEFPDHFLTGIHHVVHENIKRNPRFITHKPFVIHLQLQVNSRKHAPSHGTIYAQYQDAFSTPKSAVITINISHAFLIAFFENPARMYEIINHELQHHTQQEFEEIADLISIRAKEFVDDHLLSPQRWIALYAIAELKSEGLATLSQVLDTNKLPFLFSVSHKFERIFKMLAHASVSEAVHIKKKLHSLSYHAGCTAAATIMVYDLAEMNAPLEVHIEDEVYVWSRFRESYGTHDLFVAVYAYLHHNWESQLNHSLHQIQNISALQFLERYADACHQLKVKPFITKHLYEEVCRHAQQRFKNELKGHGLTQ